MSQRALSFKVMPAGSAAAAGLDADTAAMSLSTRTRLLQLRHSDRGSVKLATWPEASHTVRAIRGGGVAQHLGEG